MKIPTLLLWGDRDALFPRDDQDRLVAALPHATLKIYPDIGHCPNWECPEQVAADLSRVHGRDERGRKEAEGPSSNAPTRRRICLRAAGTDGARTRPLADNPPPTLAN